MSDDSDQFSKFRDNDDIKPIDFDAPGGVPANLPIDLPRLPEKRDEKPDEKPEQGGDDVDALSTLPEPPSEPEAKPKQLRDGTLIPENIADFVVDERVNTVAKGDYIDLQKKIPTLKKLFIALGWDPISMESAQVDVDLSCFLLGRDGQTRDDSDFLFYNNESASEGAIRHLGDNRVGVGAGDNESVIIDLEGLSFDVARIVATVTIYDDAMNGLHLGQVKNLYLRLIDEENEHEILRYDVPEAATDHFNSLIPFVLVREGPRWIVEVGEVSATGGLQALAQSYGIIVKEAVG